MERVFGFCFAALLLIQALCGLTSAKASEADFAAGGLPILYLNIDGGAAEIEKINNDPIHQYRGTGAADLLIPENVSTFFAGSQSSVTGMKLDYIRGRGNTSWDMGSIPKKSYKIKFEDKQNLFGFGANRHWVLLANLRDNSLLRNWLTLRLGDQLGLPYTPRGAFVEVVMNGESLGNYYLCEEVRQGKARVAIDEMKADDSAAPELWGGYFLYLLADEVCSEDNLIATSRGAEFCCKEPSFDVADDGWDNPAQQAYIRDYIQRTEDAIFARDGSWTKLLDADALADFWWINEFSVNDDAFFSSSTYLYKERFSADGGEGKLFFGPLWDFDVSWGSHMLETEVQRGLNVGGLAWITELRSQPEFVGMLAARWPAFDAKLEEITRPGGWLDQAHDVLRASWYADHARWAAIKEEIGNSIHRDFEAEIEHIRGWINLRRAWVSDHLDHLGRLYCTVTLKIEGQEDETLTEPLDAYLESWDLPEPEREGFLFTGWVLEDGSALPDPLFLEDDITLSAGFEPKAE